MAIKLNNLHLNQILILSVFFMLTSEISDEKNEMIVIIDANKSSEIINSRYYNDISQVIVNGEESNISEYENHLKIGENEITIVFKDKLNNCEYMFYRLSNILKINLSNLDLSDVKNMRFMFYYCSVVSLDLGIVNTSSVTNMKYMFCWCNSLVSLDLSYLDTSSVTKMNIYVL